MGSVKPELSQSGAVADGVEAEVRDLVRELNHGDPVAAEPSSDIVILKMSAGAIGEIDKLMDELQTARNYLHAEGERVRRMTSRYEHLTKTALASVRIISERIGEWRIGDRAVVTDDGEGPAPVQDAERRNVAITPAE
jgi:hypothetical protein